ncbi:MAG: hypothetical protein JG770_352 [Mahella sp.]|nr:hypothetical protein [Mahella sp.]
MSKLMRNVLIVIAAVLLIFIVVSLIGIAGNSHGENTESRSISITEPNE